MDGIITSELKAHRISLSRPVTELNAVPAPVFGAYVTIDDGDTTLVLTENPEGSGNYYTDSTFVGVTGKEYTLNILHLGREYTAKTEMLPVAIDFLEITFSMKISDSLYFISNVGGGYDVDDPSMYEFIIDWSHLPKYQSFPDSACKAKMWFYVLSTIDVSQLLPPSKETIYFPKNTKIIVKQYSLTPEHVAFIRSVLSETEWKGGIFDVESANTETNLSEGAIGYFGACTVISDTVEVE